MTLGRAWVLLSTVDAGNTGINSSCWSGWSRLVLRRRWLWLVTGVRRQILLRILWMLTSLHCNGPSRRCCNQLLLPSPSYHNDDPCDNGKSNEGHRQADDQAKVGTAVVVVVVVAGIPRVA